MTKFYHSSILLLLLFLSGCHECPKPKECEKTTFTHSKCPKFNAKLSIYVSELNSTHGAIKWSDVTRIEKFLKSKKNFNSKIDTINNQ